MKMVDSLISVIVPVYRVEQYLDRCVESITNQTYKYLEIILVDDGSPDNCPAICDEWMKKDHRVRVIHRENSGLSDARNAGISVAAGEYIGFVDSDDWISPEMYERLLDSMQKDGSDIACCSVEMFRDTDANRTFLVNPTNSVLNRQQAQLALLEESKLKQPVWYKLYKRNLIKGISFETGKQHEDVFWSYQAIGRANKVSIIDYVGYHYRQRDDSIMGRRFSLHNLDALEAVCQRYEYFKREFPELAQAGLIRIWENCIYDGQMSLLYLKANDLHKALEIIHDVRYKYPVTKVRHANISKSRKIWIWLSGVSLPLVCRMRNTLNIGL